MGHLLLGRQDSPVFAKASGYASGYDPTRRRGKPGFSAPGKWPTFVGFNGVKMFLPFPRIPGETEKAIDPINRACPVKCEAYLTGVNPFQYKNYN